MFLVAGGTALAAGQANPARDSLKDLGGVYVLVENVKEDIQRRGLTRDLLKADVESRLRHAGIEVFEDERQQDLARDVSNREPRGTTYLYVRVTTAGDASDGKYAYAVAVQLHQLLRTAQRDAPTLFYGPSWSSEQLGLAGADELRQRVRGAVTDLTDRFSSDYVAANPRK